MFVGVVVENFHRCRAEQEKEERARRAAKRAKKIEERRRSKYTYLTKKLLGGDSSSMWNPFLKKLIKKGICSYYIAIITKKSGSKRYQSVTPDLRKRVCAVGSVHKLRKAASEGRG